MQQQHFAGYLAAGLVCLGCAALSCKGSTAPGADGTAATPPNVVQREMRMLTATLEGAVKAIGTGDVRGIAPDLARVHAAKNATQAELKGGGYRPPKNGEQLDAFRALDDAFHKTLERLVKASKQNDVPAVAEALGVTLRGCHGCHAQFRP